jgi:type IV pilus assembly protein PilB
MATNLSKKGPTTQAPARGLKDEDISPRVLEYIPEDSAKHYKIVPLAVKDGVLEVGALDPNNLEARDALNFISAKIGMPYKLFLLGKGDFDEAIEKYKGLSGEVTQVLSELESELLAKTPIEEEKKDAKGKTETTIVEDAPVTKIVATILDHASKDNASDIHIEPTHDAVKVRFRINGELNTSLTLPIKVHSALVARIKILSNMRLDEKRKPQDGRFSAKIKEGRQIDFRVSTFPTYYGEKVVMRILDQSKGLLPLEEMGLSERNIALIKKAIKRPYGLILISGPTGSGKSTTLYSMLKEVDREHKNVLSLEDPVEYNIEGISQSQIHPEIDYTFATGLRTTLRQDPDIIMVGEIRDKETAQLAIHAALTGHLVLSTIHTNNAIGVIPRLIAMGVDPYLIAPTLILTMAQRLVRKLAPGAGKALPVEGSIKMLIEKQFADLPEAFRKEIPTSTEMYEIEPTPEYPTGISGRQAVMEVFEMDKEVEEVILRDPTEPELYSVARAKGMLTMKEDAIIKALNRIIPFEEINTL